MLATDKVIDFITTLTNVFLTRYETKKYELNERESVEFRVWKRRKTKKSDGKSRRKDKKPQIIIINRKGLTNILIK